MASKQERKVLFLDIIDSREKIRKIHIGGYIPPSYFNNAIESLIRLRKNSKILIKEYKKRFKNKLINDNNW